MPSLAAEGLVLSASRAGDREEVLGLCLASAAGVSGSYHSRIALPLPLHGQITPNDLAPLWFWLLF